MTLPDFSVRRPVFTTMVTLIVVIVGGVSLSRVKIDLMPDLDLPTVSVRTDYEGASPEVMEQLVTQIIEEIVATVPGVEELTSSSSEGTSEVQAKFTWGTDVDTAALDMRSRLEEELSELPDDVDRPQIRKFDIASYPVVLIGISSHLDPIELTELIENQFRRRLARIPGVAQADVWGGFNREVRVEIDPDRLKALNLPLSNVIHALKNSNLDLPAGRIEDGGYEVTLRAPAEFGSLADISQMVVFERDGANVTLGQVARVKDTYEKLDRIIRVNGQTGVRIAIRKQADANTVEVADAILAEIIELNHDFPQVNIVPVTNQGNFIERSIKNVANSVFYGGALAVLVLLIFLRNFRSTLVISLAIPISIVATFSLIYLGGFTLNLMTLGGLALGVGMMVDNSVVVLENIFRRKDENHETARVAAVAGANEVAGAIVASTLTTLVIFVPLAFVRGVAGVLFRELAYVIVFSLVCSLLVSLTIVPMLASRLLHSPGELHEAPRTWLSGFLDFADRFFVALDGAYHDVLIWTMGHRLITVGGAFVALALSLQLIPMIGSEFMPPSDEGEVRVTGTMDVGTRLDITDEQVRKMEAIVVAAVPEIVSSVTTVVRTGSRAQRGTEGEIRMSLAPAGERKRSNTAIAADLRKRLEGVIPGLSIKTRAPQGQFIFERIFGSQEGVTVEVRGFELDKLEELAAQVGEAIRDVAGVTDIEISRQAGVPQEEIAIDREKVADLGLTVRDVTEALQTAVAGSVAGDYRTGGDSYRILVQLADAEKRSIDDILDLTLVAADGSQVAIRNLVSTVTTRGPVTIERKDQERLIKVEANVADRDLGSVAKDIKARLAAIPRSAAYELAVAGNFEEQQKAFSELAVSLILALVLVYMVLACQYESLRNPLVVMASVPVAAIGVLIILFLTESTLNLQSYIGCIMLGGIVVNNAILLVDQADQLRREGASVVDAVTEAGRRRLRPILMTSLTTILALLPLAMGIGEGADAQAPLARAVVGGLTGSTLITLVLVPAVYSLFHPERRRAVS